MRCGWCWQVDWRRWNWRAPARGSVDEYGRVRLEVPELPGRDVIAALGRVGVQVQVSSDLAMEPVRCWAELLYLRPSSVVSPGTVLFIGPDRAAPRLVGRLRRSAGRAVGVALHDSPTPRQAWITSRHATTRLLGETAEAGTIFESYYEQSPSIWVRLGWEHPLPELLCLPAESALLVRPARTISVVPAGIPACDVEDFTLPSVRSGSTAKSGRSVAIPLRFYLTARPSPLPETLWVLEDETVAEFWHICASVDERLLRRLEIAEYESGTHTRLIVRGSENSRPTTFLTLAKTGYAPHPVIPNLFIPGNRELRPVLRARDLAIAFGLAGDCVVWLAPQSDGGVIPHAVGRSEFRLLSEFVAYTTSPTVALAVESRTDPFPLDRLVAMTDAVPVLDLEPLPVITDEMEEPLPPRETLAAREPAWFVRAWRKLRSQRRREPAPAPEPARDAVEEHVPENRADQRVRQTLGSPEALRLGPDWAARRRELETGLIQELPHLGTDERAARWATLGSVYGKLGHPGDAAVCWLNAIWESPAPPLPWLHQWLAMEYQAAKLAESERDLDRWLGERRPGIGRVVAAYTTVAGHTQSAPEFLADLPRILAFLDYQFEDLPLRSAWLARLAAARVCDGDALGLARWHDRLLVRLADRGPGLDLDEPSFLRFHGSVSGERFQAARKCLESIHEKVHRWIERHARPGRKLQSDRLLQWAGIIAEKEATSAYADFMLAWGIGSLGERIQANTWAGRARKRLAGAASPGVDPAAHAVLADLFLNRIKDAQEGRPPKSGLPLDLQQRLEALPDFPRYAVDRLRDHARILEPLDQVRSYRGRDLKGILGSDRLGERLYLLLDRTDPKHIAEEAGTLLQLCTETPTTEVVPRIVLTLLEIAAHLDTAMQLRVLDHVPTALDWLEPWLAAFRGADLRERLGRVRTRMIKTVFTAAAFLDQSQVGTAIGQLIQKLRQFGSPVRDALIGIAPHVFRSLRRLDLRSEAESLVQFLDPDRDRPDAPLSARLGLAIGWFIAGNDETGHRTLNEAREVLYLDRNLDMRQRTELSLAYAEALGFAPLGIAHGRLCEIFERLDRVAFSGSTNRYFTLKPLQLIDVVVRAVVTDEFALGPAVRGWLDDDEFLIRGRIHRDLAAVLKEQGIA